MSSRKTRRWFTRSIVAASLLAAGCSRSGMPTVPRPPRGPSAWNRQQCEVAGQAKIPCQFQGDGKGKNGRTGAEPLRLTG